MTFLPIIERELHVRARRGATHWTRCGVGGLAGALCLMQISVASVFSNATSAAGTAFQGLVACAFLLCLGACLLTADSISSERREGTLGLLFLTEVRNLDLLLGKLGAAGFAGVCWLLVLLPVLMIPVLYGSLTAGEVFRAGLMLTETLFLALAVGLWASARGDDWLATMRKAALTLLGILILPGLYGLLTRDLPLWSQVAGACSPFTGLAATNDLSYRAAPARLWLSALLLPSMGVAFLWRAGVLLRHSLREVPAPSAGPAHAPVLSDAVPVRQRRRRPLTDAADPMGWLLARQRGLWVGVWGGVLLVVALRFSYSFLYRFVTPGSALPILLWPMSLVVHVAQGALFAWAASRFFVETRRTGELEWLVTTPQGAETIVSAQWARLRRLVAWPVTVLVLVNVGQALPALWQWYVSPAGSWGAYYAGSLGLGCVNICAQTLALCWMGMWFGLRTRSQATAIAWTVGLVVLAPDTMMMGVMLVFSAFNALFRITGGFAPGQIASWLAQVLSICFCLWLIRGARRRIGQALREPDLTSLGLTRSLGGLWRSGLTAFRKARRWTPA